LTARISIGGERSEADVAGIVSGIISTATVNHDDSGPQPAVLTLTEAVPEKNSFQFTVALAVAVAIFGSVMVALSPAAVGLVLEMVKIVLVDTADTLNRSLIPI
jgi:hypothetical protein